MECKSIEQLGRHIVKRVEIYGYSPPKPVIVYIFFHDKWVPTTVQISYKNLCDKRYICIEIEARIEESKTWTDKGDIVWFRYDEYDHQFVGKISSKSYQTFKNMKYRVTQRQTYGSIRHMYSTDCDVIYELFEKVMTEIQVEFKYHDN